MDSYLRCDHVVIESFEFHKLVVSPCFLYFSIIKAYNQISITYSRETKREREERKVRGKEEKKIMRKQGKEAQKIQVGYMYMYSNL